MFQHRCKFRFVYNTNAQFLRLIKLTACLFARNDERCRFRHRALANAAAVLYHFLRRASFIPLQAARQNNVLACKNPETAKKLQLDMIELCDALFCEVNPIPVKAALKLLGWNTGSLRLPLTEISEKGMSQLKQAMENYGLLK